MKTTTEVVAALRARAVETDLGYVTPCLIWQDGQDAYGYPSVQVNGRWPKAFRVMYEALIGPIPDGLVLDHLCHTADPTCSGRCAHRLCIEPTHGDPITRGLNTVRGHHPRGPRPEAERFTCPSGHTKTRRESGALVCHVCDADRARARRAARRV